MLFDNSTHSCSGMPQNLLLYQLEEITPQQLQSAEKRRAAAGTAREAAQRDVDLIQSRWETATAAAGEQTVDDAASSVQQIRQQLSVLRKAQKEDYASFEPRAERVRDFTRFVDTYFRKTVYVEKCKSWYKSDGDVAAGPIQLNPNFGALITRPRLHQALEEGERVIHLCRK